MEDKFFNLDEELVNFAEMNGFDFVSGRYVSQNEELPAVKSGTFDVLDMIKNMFQSEQVIQR